jgi:hypothetical protein
MIIIVEKLMRTVFFFSNLNDFICIGCFDKKKIIPLVTTPDSYPVWYTLNPVVLPKGKIFF